MNRDPFVCGGCDRRFRSVTGFDAHRVPVNEDTCVDPATLTRNDGTRRYQLNSHGEWIRTDTFTGPDPGLS